MGGYNFYSEQHFLTLQTTDYSVPNSIRATQRFSANRKASWQQKDWGCSCFQTNHNSGKILLLVWAGIGAKRYTNVHFNASSYSEITFILVNGERSKRQEKQLIADWRAVILKTKWTQCKICFTAWRPRSLNTKQTRHKCILFNESQECWGRKRLKTKILVNDEDKKKSKIK